MKRARARAIVCVLAIGAVGAGCASPAPVLYDNAHRRSVSDARAERDIAECRELAHAAVARDRSGDVVRRAGEDAVVGGVTGGAVGGIVGGHSVGRGAAAGAAAGAARTVTRSIFRRNQPDPIEAAWVNRCLADRGYEVLGWR